MYVRNPSCAEVELVLYDAETFGEDDFVGTGSFSIAELMVDQTNLPILSDYNSKHGV